MPYTEPKEGQGKDDVTKVTRRSFPVKEKLRIVAELVASQKNGPGDVGAFLRREGVGSGQAYKWKKEWETGILHPGRTERRGPVKALVNPLQTDLEEANKRIAKLEMLVQKQNLMLDFQKKIFKLAEEIQPPDGASSGL
jgi:transposase-like protein